MISAQRFWSYSALAAALTASLAMMSLEEPRRIYWARRITTACFEVGEVLLSRLIRLGTISRENRFLRRQNVELALHVQRLREAQRENERLRRLLGFKRRAHRPLLPAEVVAYNPDRMRHTVLLNVGSRDGVDKDMPVVTAEGLVGRVIEVYPESCLVLLLTDRSSRVSVVVQDGGRTLAIAEGQGEEMLYANLPLRSPARGGEEVVSSGMGGVFPKGVPVGRVSRVLGEEQGLLKKVVIEPSAPLGHLEEVFVMLYRGPRTF
ncbi:MAG TPA: rod shape-determining protein MreC [Candidatus Latescibacteria bacterium]|nr:rod shape-determining protein MreC [Candidatus Latescibacterota bacterium]